MADKPPRRQRGGQPGNRNALKHGRYTRLRHQVRDIENLLYRYEQLGGDGRSLRRFRPIVERLKHEEAQLRQDVIDRIARKSLPIKPWMQDEIARAEAENRDLENE